MFDKFKQLQQLRQLQGKIKQQRAEAEHDGVRVVISGEFEIVDLTLNPALDIETQKRALLRAFNNARAKMQGLLAKDLAGGMF